MVKTLIFYFCILLLTISTYGSVFINTPSLEFNNYFDLSHRGYTSSGKDYSLDVYSINIYKKISNDFSYSIKRSDYNTSEKNVKYLSASTEYNLYFKSGNIDYLINFLDNEKSLFYDSLIFYFDSVGFGINFNGSDDKEAWARYGSYDVTLFKQKTKTSSPMKSSDFVQKFFFVMNYSFKINDRWNIKFDYNGDYNTFSANYKTENFDFEIGSKETGDYDELMTLASVKQDKSFFKITYRF